MTCPLTDPELDAFLAERAMGWTWKKCGPFQGCYSRNEFLEGWWDAQGFFKKDWKPSRDLLQVWLVQAELERRGLMRPYSVALAANVAPDAAAHGWQPWHDSWALINATPRARAEAAWSVLKDLQGVG